MYPIRNKFKVWEVGRTWGKEMTEDAGACSKGRHKPIKVEKPWSKGRFQRALIYVGNYNDLNEDEHPLLSGILDRDTCSRVSNSAKCLSKSRSNRISPSCLTNSSLKPSNSLVARACK